MLILLQLAATQRPPTVNTAVGVIEGTSVGAATNAYLGIAYANASRWAAPVDRATRSKTAIDATRFGASCPQEDPGQIWNEQYISEQCLSLNIWTPQQRRSQKSLPVLVFLFGGGYTSGGSNGYNCSVLGRILL